MCVRKGLICDKIDPIPTTEPTANEQLTITLLTNDKQLLYISTLYCPAGKPSDEIIDGFCKGRKNVILTGGFNSKCTYFGNKKDTPLGVRLRDTTIHNGLTLINDDTPTYRDNYTATEDILDLIFLSPSVLTKYKDFWVGEDLGSDHIVTVCELAYSPLYDTTEDRTVSLYHKAD